MIHRKLEKNYVSEADQLLAKKREEFPLSDSQKKTIAKNARIAKLRDPQPTDPEK